MLALPADVESAWESNSAGTPANSRPHTNTRGEFDTIHSAFLETSLRGSKISTRADQPLQDDIRRSIRYYAPDIYLVLAAVSFNNDRVQIHAVSDYRTMIPGLVESPNSDPLLCRLLAVQASQLLAGFVNIAVPASIEHVLGIYLPNTNDRTTASFAVEIEVCTLPPLPFPINLRQTQPIRVLNQRFYTVCTKPYPREE